MSEQQLKSILNSILSPDKDTYKKAVARLDLLAKPPGSLGGFEVIAARIAAITGQIYNKPDKRCVLVFSADNGVVEEGVSSAPQAVTAIQTVNILNGVTGVGILAAYYKSDVVVIDVGINADIEHERLINRKIRKATNNIVRQSAMTREEALKAIIIGIDEVKKAHEKGYMIIGVGEMGIGNTTTSSAVLSALLGLNGTDIESTVGKGAGLTEEGFFKKVAAVKTALEINSPCRTDPIDILSKVGGFDLAAMTGAFIGAAYYRIPVVIDGFISIVAALCAVRLNKLVEDYLFTSHYSDEQGYKLAIDQLNMKVYLHMDMRLGEGSGCPIMFGIMSAACAIIQNMATFEEANISTEYLDNLNLNKAE